MLGAPSSICSSDRHDKVWIRQWASVACSASFQRYAIRVLLVRKIVRANRSVRTIETARASKITRYTSRIGSMKTAYNNYFIGDR